jgi:hypothetical protein
MLLEGYIGEKLVFRGNESEFSSGSDWTGTIRAGEIVKVNGERRRVIQLMEKPNNKENEEKIFIMKLA